MTEYRGVWTAGLMKLVFPLQLDKEVLLSILGALTALCQLNPEVNHPSSPKFKIYTKVLTRIFNQLHL